MAASRRCRGAALLLCAAPLLGAAGFTTTLGDWLSGRGADGSGESGAPVALDPASSVALADAVGDAAQQPWLPASRARSAPLDPPQQPQQSEQLLLRRHGGDHQQQQQQQQQQEEEEEEASAARPCGKFSPPHRAAKISPRDYLREESGLKESLKNPNVLWAHNDNFGPARIFAVDADTGAILRVLSLEGLPPITEFTDFEDLTVAPCPHQGAAAMAALAHRGESSNMDGMGNINLNDINDINGDGNVTAEAFDGAREEAGAAAAAAEWCILLGDIGHNVGEKDIHILAIREPDVDPARGPNLSTHYVDPWDVLLFRVDYGPVQKTPNAEAMTTLGDGSQLWILEKTHKNGGEGPAGVWASPQVVRAGGPGYGVPRVCRRSSSSSNWRCEDDPHYSGYHRHDVGDGDAAAGDGGDGGDNEEARRGPWENSRQWAVMHTLRMEQVAQLANPYPRCSGYHGEEVRMQAGMAEAFVRELGGEGRLGDRICVGPELQPPGEYSCLEQAEWGKCEEPWMLEEGYCARSCGRCVVNATAEALLEQVPDELLADHAWEALEARCGRHKHSLASVRNIAAADLHASGDRLLVATYGGLFEYHLPAKNDLRGLRFLRQISTTNRDGSTDQSGQFWRGQEGAAYSYRGKGGVWSVSETHQHLFKLDCDDPWA